MLLPLRLEGEETVGSGVEKFNIVSNDHGRMQKCDSSVFDRKLPLSA